jgi:acetylornithine deacetylase/succinyl-diaminopimelate desuccinylase-like protein
VRRAALAFARANRSHFLRDLQEFVRFPSISVDPARATDVRRCGHWLASELRRIGLRNVAVIRTKRHPIVRADWFGAVGRPTILIYGHYDVQPVDPLSEWRTPPFEPTVRGDDLYGRGVCDDKGQLLAHVKALQSYLRTSGRLPVNVKCLFEGEEEIGSPNLRAFLDQNRGGFRVDAAAMSDTRMLGPDRPALTYSLRGSLSLELEVRGPSHDLHSGNLGGAVHNPLQALAEILASLHRPDGRIAIAGFYDDVRSVSTSERARMVASGPTDAQIRRVAGVPTGWGERGYSLYERTTIRPSLTINGLSGGYQGSGAKAVIPARASAKLNLRLTPTQDPARVEGLFRAHVARVTPRTVRSHVTAFTGANPAVIDRTSPALAAAAVAYRRGFGVPPVLVRSGGTIPVVNTFTELLGLSTVLMGFALPDDRIHAPNEKFHLPNYERGIATCIHFLYEFARSPGRQAAR